jgi:hypothetical protein
LSAEYDTSNTDDAPNTNHDAPAENTPSAGWREICHRLGVDPDATHPPADATTAAAVLDEDRPRRTRRKHAGGRSS